MRVRLVDLGRTKLLLAGALDLGGVVRDLVVSGDAPIELEAAYEAWATTCEDYQALALGGDE